MKSLYSMTGAVFLTITQCAFAGNAENLTFVNKTVDQITYAEQQQNLVWPGFHPAATASIIMIDDTDKNHAAKNMYAINFKPGLLPWEKINSSIYYLQNNDSIDIEYGNDSTFMDVDGQHSYIDVESLESITATENVHNKFMTMRATNYIQHDANIKPNNFEYANIVYDRFNDPATLKLIYLEDAALTLSQQADTALAEVALRDAVAIHQYRNQQASKEARQFEDGTEIVSGIPTYIAWTSQHLNEDNFRKMSQRTGCSPLNAMLGQAGLSTCALQNFPVFTSTVYGHALDKKLGNTPWKSDLTQSFKPISQIAIDYYHFSDADAKVITEHAMNKSEYHYDRIVRLVDTAMTPYLKKMAEAKAQYAAADGIELRITPVIGMFLMIMPIFGYESYTDVYQISNNHSLMVDISLADDAIGNLGTLKAKHIPFASVETAIKDFDIDPDKSWTIFKLSNDAQLIIDGVAQSASGFVTAGKKQSYTTLTIKDAHMEYTPKYVGVLDAADGRLTLITGDKAHIVKQDLISEWLYRRAIKPTSK